jgi:hypothetical protein
MPVRVKKMRRRKEKFASRLRAARSLRRFGEGREADIRATFLIVQSL